MDEPRETCSICLEGVEEGTASIVECSRCSTRVHESCQAKWRVVLTALGKRDRCTICRKPVDEEEQEQNISTSNSGSGEVSSNRPTMISNDQGMIYLQNLVDDGDWEALDCELKSMRNLVRARFSTTCSRVCNRKAVVRHDTVISMTTPEDTIAFSIDAMRRLSSNGADNRPRNEGRKEKFTPIVANEISKSLSHFERTFHAATAEGRQRLSSPFFRAWSRFTTEGALAPILELSNVLSQWEQEDELRNGDDGARRRIFHVFATTTEGVLVDVTSAVKAELQELLNLVAAIYRYRASLELLEASPRYKERLARESSWERARHRVDIENEDRHRQRVAFTLNEVVNGGQGSRGGESMGFDCWL